MKTVQLHPKDAKIGTCEKLFGNSVLINEADLQELQKSTDGTRVTLMGWGNFIL